MYFIWLFIWEWKKIDNWWLILKNLKRYFQKWDIKIESWFEINKSENSYKWIIWFRNIYINYEILIILL